MRVVLAELYSFFRLEALGAASRMKSCVKFKLLVLAASPKKPMVIRTAEIEADRPDAKQDPETGMIHAPSSSASAANDRLSHESPRRTDVVEAIQRRPHEREECTTALVSAACELQRARARAEGRSDLQGSAGGW